ncbi:MAG TPA: hypothetical protein VHV55_00250 [Pirellulales bacterium]|jgi:hypothetical protein|nr:hypothetical protein [Pirellulales bacterium]
MKPLPYVESPPLALGLMAVILGSVGSLLFFLPILGAPLSAIGLVIGLAGFAKGIGRDVEGVRWSLGGIVVCVMGLTINVAVDYAPEGYIEDRSVPPMWQTAPDRPYVPPPAQSRLPK